MLERAQRAELRTEHLMQELQESRRVQEEILSALEEQRAAYAQQELIIDLDQSGHDAKLASFQQVFEGVRRDRDFNENSGPDTLNTVNRGFAIGGESHWGVGTKTKTTESSLSQFMCNGPGYSSSCSTDITHGILYPHGNSKSRPSTI